MVFIAIDSNCMLTETGDSLQPDVSYYLGITVKLQSVHKEYDSNLVSCQNVSVSVYFLMDSVWQCRFVVVTVTDIKTDTVVPVAHFRKGAEQIFLLVQDQANVLSV